MPLSPFKARLSLATFLTISTAIAANILMLQKPAATMGEARARSERARLAMDAERLGRLAGEAVGGGNFSRPSATERPSSAADSVVHRIGSFAPSAAGLARQALPGADPAEARKATVREIQSELARRGYEPGAADGEPGLVTRAAVLAYEHDQGLPLTAVPSPEVLAHLRYGTSAPGAAIGLDGTAKAPAGQAEAVIRSVQQSLRTLGYLGFEADGRMSDDTIRAIREFEMDMGLVPSGRISAPLVARLARQLSSRRSG
jgi:peptidoglycan hydrolase-like protein with peptidoglycan-binding domain